MGIGIWAMHFKGMLAFHLPVPVEYHWPTVLASLLVAVLASAVALYVSSRHKMGPVEALTGSIFMGAGIAGMHYIGMAAMRLPAITRYSPLLVTCSILLAILFSLIALLYGVRSTRGDQMECSAKAGQRNRDGSRCLRDALHRNGGRKFHPRFASGPFPRREHFPRWQLWSCHCCLDRACGGRHNIICGPAPK